MMAEDINLEFGDSVALLKALSDGSVNLVVADPPYYRIMVTEWNGIKHEWDDQWKDFEEYLDWTNKWVSEVKRVLKENASLYVFADDKLAAYVRIEIEKLGFQLVNEIIWVKRNAMANKGWRGYRSYSPITERILFFSRQFSGNEIKRYFEPRNNFTDVWISNLTSSTDEHFHPTQKPLWLIKRIVETSSEINDVVLDPFMGSGTTAIACLETKRKFIGYESNIEYFEIAKRRIEQRSSIADIFEFDKEVS